MVGGKRSTTSTAPPAPGASTAALGIAGRLGSWFGHHRAVALGSLANLFESWMASVMTWLVIGIALGLPTILYLLLVNVGDVSADWDGRPRISVYLASGLADGDARQLANELGRMPDVASTSYISPEQALKEFQARSGFGDVLNSLDANPLPPVVEIVPSAREPAALKLLVVKLENTAGVDSVSVDLAWIERLFAILALGERFVAALGFFLGLGVLLSIGNTIRLAIENRRSEIEVVKLVGGTDSFVRRPFLYLGFWYGLGGAVMAWLMVQCSLWFLAGPVDRLVQSYDDEFALVGLDLATTAILLVCGGLLGVLGASLAVGRHLHQIEPS
jgi:cell division transport system permease protein